MKTRVFTFLTTICFLMGGSALNADPRPSELGGAYPWEKVTQGYEEPTADGKWDHILYLADNPKILEMPSPCGDAGEVLKICVGIGYAYKRPKPNIRALGTFELHTVSCNLTIDGKCPTASKCYDSQVFLSLNPTPTSRAKEDTRFRCQTKDGKPVDHSAGDNRQHAPNTRPTTASTRPR